MKKLLIFLTILTMSANMFCVKTLRNNKDKLKLLKAARENFKKSHISLYDKPEALNRHQSKQIKKENKKYDIVRCEFGYPIEIKFSNNIEHYFTNCILLLKTKQLVFNGNFFTHDDIHDPKLLKVIFTKKDFENHPFKNILINIIKEMQKKASNNNIKESLTSFINFFTKKKPKLFEKQKTGELSDTIIHTES